MKAEGKDIRKPLVGVGMMKNRGGNRKIAYVEHINVGKVRADGGDKELD